MKFRLAIQAVLAAFILVGLAGPKVILAADPPPESVDWCSFVNWADAMNIEKQLNFSLKKGIEEGSALDYDKVGKVVFYLPSENLVDLAFQLGLSKSALPNGPHGQKNVINSLGRVKVEWQNGNRWRVTVRPHNFLPCPPPPGLESGNPAIDFLTYLVRDRLGIWIIALILGGLVLRGGFGLLRRAF